MYFSFSCLFYLCPLYPSPGVLIASLLYELKANWHYKRQSSFCFSLCLLKPPPKPTIFDHISIKLNAYLFHIPSHFLSIHCLVSIYKSHGLQTEILPQRHTWLNLYASLTGKKQRRCSGLTLSSFWRESCCEKWTYVRAHWEIWKCCDWKWWYGLLSEDLFWMCSFRIIY